MHSLLRHTQGICCHLLTHSFSLALEDFLELFWINRLPCASPSDRFRHSFVVIRQHGLICHFVD